jgi:multiple sugar transport system permease protein
MKQRGYRGHGLAAVGNFLDDNFKVVSVIPMLLIITGIIAYPLLYLIVLSFTDTNNFNIVSGGAKFIGFNNFLRNFKDKALFASIGNTLYFTFIIVSLSTVIGILLGYIIYHLKASAKNHMIAFVLLPTLISESACSLIFKPMLNASIGVFNYVLNLAGIESINFLGDRTVAKCVLIIISIWRSAPYMFIFVLSGIESLDTAYFEVARIDGASGLQVLRKIVLPLLRPIIAVAAFFQLTGYLRFFDLVYVLTGGGPGAATETLAIYIQKIGIKRMEFGYSSASGIIMLIITAIFGAAALKVMYDSTNSTT